VDDQALKLYAEYRGRLEAQLQAAYDQFDKAILTLSGGALALSIGFIKDVVPLSRALWKPLLVTSWLGFALAVLLTVVSFQVSQRAYEFQIDCAQDYYVNNRVDALKRRNHYSVCVRRLNIVAIVTFMLAVVLTICFVAENAMAGKS
jgi:hypothetical protein